MNEIHINIFLECLLACDGNENAALERAEQEYKIGRGQRDSWTEALGRWI